MNINDYAPKHVDLEEVKAKAVRYEGTFEELKRLHQEGKVTLVTGSTGEVTGLWVDSGTGDLMADNLSGENFNRAYGFKPVMQWLDMILRGEEPAPVVDRPVQKAAFENDAEPTEEMEIAYSELHGHEYDLNYIKGYIRNKTGRCFAKGTISGLRYNFDDNAEVVKVSNIYYGRKLTDEERAGWDVETGEYYNK